jgi:acetoin utilization deacetylase AcuC-like enzyme
VNLWADISVIQVHSMDSMRKVSPMPTLHMPVVATDRHRLHRPEGEVWVGVRIPGTEVPERVDSIRGALDRSGAGLVEPADHGLDPILAVHDASLVEFLATAWDRWAASGYPDDPGMDRVVPYAFPLPGMFAGHEPRVPASIGALTGLYAMDTMTLIGPATWDAVQAAAWCAVTAADLVAGGAPAAYALCRPPGHHAARAVYGGSCYLNNAAVAAQRLRERGAATVAIVDVDAHHGNGTQQIFYGRADVRYGSVHVDPGRGWFPHFLGFAEETGAGEGEGANLNLPLPPGEEDAGWLEAVDRLVEFAGHTDALVVSLGVDAAADDPESPLRVTGAGYVEAGRSLGALGVPTVIVQEGGYHLPTLGSLVAGFLIGFEEAS